MKPYYALALQTPLQAVNSCQSRDEARAVMQATLARLETEVAASKQFIGPDLRLVVLPEYVLTAYPMGDTIAGWADKAALDMDGPEYQALGRIARDNDIYLSGNAYEVDPHFGDFYFQCSFIIDPTGKVILRYRRLNSMFAPTPHDVWDKYLEIYGFEGVFPVVTTEIGHLACVASEEILYPEISRILCMRGAEVILHASGEGANLHETPKSIARKARAIENLAYVVSANSAGIDGHPLPRSSTDGKSIIIDYRGLVLAESGWGATMTANSAIDIAALRHYRQRPGMGNFLLRQRFELFTHGYSTLGSQSANRFLDDAGQLIQPERNDFAKAQTEALARLKKRGFFD